MAKSDYREHLRAVPLFAKLSNKQLDEVVRIATEISLPAGHVYAREGDIGLDMFVILDGTVEVRRDGGEVKTIGPGHFVGELALLTDYRRRATVVAATDLDVLVLTRMGLDQLMDDVPGLAKTLLFDVVDRLVQYVDDA